MIVAALQGEGLDALVWRATGRDIGAVETVLAANAGLAEIAVALPEGHAVTIPELAATTVELDIVQLWD